MSRRMPIVVLLYTVITLSVSCEHKELFYPYSHTTAARIDVDWSRFTPYEVPTGMTLVLYPQTSGGSAVTHLTNTTSHAVLNLPTDRYHVLVFNQSISEFGTLSFQGLDKQETAAVVSIEQKSRWYALRNESEKVAVSPEWLGVGNAGDAVVTQAMIDTEEEAMMQTATRSTPSSIASVTPVNIISTVRVRLRIKGIQNLRSARASLNGMAEGYHLTTMRPTKSKVTHLMEAWTMKRDATDPTSGVIETSFTCFGLPEGHQSAAAENMLSVSLLLVDNKTIKEYSFSVGDHFVLGDPATRESQSNPEQETEAHLNITLDLETDITLPDVQPEGGTSGGFDAHVEDWGDEQEYKVKI